MLATGAPTKTPPAPQSSTEVPAVVSLVLRRLIEGPVTEGEVLGSSRHAVWIRLGEALVVAHSADAVQLPNGMRLGLRAEQLELDSVAHGGTALVGEHILVVGGLRVRAVRWWDPQVRLPRCSVETVRSSLSVIPRVSSSCLRVEGAAADLDPVEFAAATSEILGRGPGLTPASDDYLAGLIGGLRLFGDSIGNDRAPGFLIRVRPEIMRMARSRTSALSASLMELAFDGRMAAPVADLARALSGRGDVQAAHHGVLMVGHTSGPALAAGLMAGARISIEGEPS